jgi:Fe-S-cluster containining protein
VTTESAGALFKEITRLERGAARNEINLLGWRPALANSQHRQDAMAALIARSVTPVIACKSGCWYCCYYRVEARAEEVLQIAAYVSKTFSSSKLASLQQQVARHAESLSAMSHQEQLQANLKCPLLADGVCSVYELRPARCRTFHATDVNGCRQSWQEPENLAIPGTLIPELYQAGEAHLDGFRAAMTDAGYDSSVYELNAALSLALADNTPKRRFEKHKRAFVGLSVPRDN